MLRPTIVGVLMLASLASCEQIKNMRGVPALVRAGDPQACIHPETTALLDRIIRRGESDDPITTEEIDAIPLSITDTSMTAVEKGVSVTCTSNVAFKQWEAKQYQYRVIPTADGSDFQITWDDRIYNPYDLAKYAWEQELLKPDIAPQPLPAVERKPATPLPTGTSNTSQRAALIRSFETQAVANANAREARAAAANGESDPYKFAAGERTIKEGDLDGDGDQDAVVLTLICEEINCHATTQSSVAGLLINDGGSWRLATSRVLEGAGSITRVSPAGAVVTTLEFGPDDPDCCASQERAHTIRLGN